NNSTVISLIRLTKLRPSGILWRGNVKFLCPKGFLCSLLLPSELTEQRSAVFVAPSRHVGIRKRTCRTRETVIGPLPRISGATFHQLESFGIIRKPPARFRIHALSFLQGTERRNLGHPAMFGVNLMDWFTKEAGEGVQISHRLPAVICRILKSLFFRRVRKK